MKIRKKNATTVSWLREKASCIAITVSTGFLEIMRLIPFLRFQPKRKKAIPLCVHPNIYASCIQFIDKDGTLYQHGVIHCPEPKCNYMVSIRPQTPKKTYINIRDYL